MNARWTRPFVTILIRAVGYDLHAGSEIDRLVEHTGLGVTDPEQGY